MYSDPNLEAKLIEHEGMRKTVYADTLGHLTIGIGFRVDDGSDGLFPEEMFFILRNRLNKLYDKLSQYSWFKTQNDVRQAVLIELAYNMGVDGLLSFKRMIKALEPLNPALAAKELLDSRWEGQVKQKRAQDIANRLRTGRYVNG